MTMLLSPSPLKDSALCLCRAHVTALHLPPAPTLLGMGGNSPWPRLSFNPGPGAGEDGL